MRKSLCAAGLAVSLMVPASAVYAVADIIETPAMKSDLAPESLLNDAVRAGDRILAVGERGHIIYSDDEGKSWTQSDVPVATTLTGISFGSDTHGWAVGHSGVILHSDDAGATWELQMSGVDAAELAIAAKEEQAEAMQERIEEAPEEEKGDLEWALDDIYFALDNLQSDMDIGPVNPLLDVWFENDRHGIAVGAYGMALQNRDGSQTWRYMADELENRQAFHLNSVARLTGGALVIVGEAGQVHVSTDNGESWERRESPYDGSLFGVLGTGQMNEMLIFGLRGNMFMSTDLGRTWRTITNTAGATLNNGAVPDKNEVVLVGNGGTVLMSANGAESFREHFRDDREGVMDVVPVSGNNLLLFGEGGVKKTDARGRNLQ